MKAIKTPAPVFPFSPFPFVTAFRILAYPMEIDLRPRILRAVGFRCIPAVSLDSHSCSAAARLSPAVFVNCSPASSKAPFIYFRPRSLYGIKPLRQLPAMYPYAPACTGTENSDPALEICADHLLLFDCFVRNNLKTLYLEFRKDPANSPLLRLENYPVSAFDPAYIWAFVSGKY